VGFKPKSDELRRVFAACRGYFVSAAIFSLAINILYLAAPLYMLQVYDRVVSSGSTVTLVMLTVALMMAFVALAGLDGVRARVLVRAGIRLDRLLAGRVVAATVEATGDGAAHSQPLRDFDTFRQYITGSGIHAVFDLPWAPIYIGVIFLLHPVLGFFALGSAAVLVVMALVNQWLVQRPLGEAGEAAQRNYSFTEMGLRNAEVVRALGMADGLIRRWSRDRNRVLERQTVASDRAAAMSSLIKFMRMSMQSVILGIGAYLAIERLTTVGAIFAASILLGRALQPVEQVVGSWRNLVSARSAYRRVHDLLVGHPPRERAVALPRPAGRLTVEDVNFALPGTAKFILHGVSFRLEPGEALGIIGPSGAGKSTLARHLVGVLRATSGAVRLDDADVSIWAHQSLGRHLGYLPQDIELFADTVAANISRFQTDCDAEIVQAAQRAGVHDMILRLPNGYETEVGEGGAVLSGGYRQRIALARAVFGDPSLVVLDEPSSNLDSEGDAALAECIAQLKATGTTVVIISHRPATLASVNKILLLRDGMVETYGERAEVLARLTRAVPMRAVAVAPAAANTAAAGA
jgi:PrtD family type I secretion system ABC transporter